MTKKSPRQWVYSPKSAPKPKIPEAIKQTVTDRCNALVENVLKPKAVQPPPEDADFNYIVDLSTKWHGSYFYFCATYRCPGDNCISEFFEIRFARLEYAGGDRFHMAYMRYTDQWQEIFRDLTLDECLDSIENDPMFMP
ncbi:MAG: hypothetical protein JXB07_11755 [Anaerolineae bacterium]|nr:hypothetical protein [Anaerolineae bacterium]